MPAANVAIIPCFFRRIWRFCQTRVSRAKGAGDGNVNGADMFIAPGWISSPAILRKEMAEAL
jgi:hypothetical protein